MVEADMISAILGRPISLPVSRWELCERAERVAQEREKHSTGDVNGKKADHADPCLREIW